MKERILSFLMSLIMVFSLVQPVYATEEAASVTAASVSAYAGDTVTIAVSGKHFENLGSLDLEIYYDDSAMSLKSVFAGTLFKDAVLNINKDNLGVVKVSAISLDGISGNGELIKLSFALNPETTAGEYPIQVTIGEAYDVELNAVSISGNSGGITVNQKEIVQKEFNLYANTNVSTAKKGDLLTLKIYNSSRYNFASGNFQIEYDSELFEIEEVRLHSNLKNEHAVYDINTSILGRVRVTYASNREINSYNLMEIDFKAIADVNTTTNLIVTASDVYAEDLSEYLGNSYSRSVRFLKSEEVIDYPNLEMGVQDMVVGKEYTTALHLEEGVPVGAADFSLNYDTSVFECISVETTFDAADNGAMIMINPIFSDGLIKFSYVNTSGYDGGVDLINITWKVLSVPLEHYEITCEGTGVKTIDYQDIQLEYVPSSGCIYDFEVTKPDCVTEGYTTYTCVCGRRYINDYVTENGHTEVLDEAVLPTCTENGLTEGKHCSVCKEVLIPQEEVPALEHLFENYTLNGDGTKTATCERCPETTTIKDAVYSGNYGENITWFIDSRNILYVEGEGNMPEGNVPWSDYCQVIENIVFDETITGISANAFSGFTKLKEITIPDTIISIGAGAFDKSENIIFHVNYNSDAYLWLKQEGYENIDARIAFEHISLPETMTLTLGQAKEFGVKIVPENTTDEISIEWEIADDTIISYDQETGIVTPLSLGETAITVTESVSGKTASTTVKVILPKTDTLKAEFNTPIEAIGLQQGDHRTLCISSKTAGVITNDKFNFKSSNPGALQVDEKGVITSCYTGTGAATVSITATLKADSSKKVTVKVNAIAKQAETITFDVQIPAGYEDLVKVVYDEETLIQTVIVSRTAIKDGKLPFKVTAISKDMDGNELPVSIKWSTSNSKAVAVAATKGVLNESTVTVQKNVNDIVEITAAANDKKKTKAALDVDVRDYTPRLLSNSVTLNTNKLEGVSVRLLTAYDALLKNYNKEMLMMLSGLDDVINVSLEGNDAFTASYDKDSHLVTFYANKQMPNKKTYKLKLYVNTTQGLTEQSVTIKTANSLPTVSLKQKSTFNTFYKDSEAVVNVAAKNANITNVTLSDTNTFKIVFDSITKQWELMFADGYTGGKADVSAKVRVEFEGYRTPVVKSLSIKAKETQPKLQQSRSTTALTYLNIGSEPITVLNKTSNENLNFDGLTWKITSDSAAYAEIVPTGTEIKVTPILQSNKFINNKTSHTFKLQVQADNWMKPITLSHTISVSLNKPSVSTKNTKLTLRTLYADQAEIVFKPSVTSCTAPVDYLIVPNTTNTEIIEQANKLSFTEDKWSIEVGLDAANAPTAGKYSYKVTPVIENDLHEKVQLNTVTVTVTVSSSNPTISLKTKTLTLNAANYAGEVKTIVVPSENDCPIPVRYTIVPADKKTSVKQQAEKIKFAYDQWNVSADFKDLNDLPKNGSYKYNITAFVENPSGVEIALKSTSLTVKVNTTVPKVTLKKSSITLNKAVKEKVIFGTTVNAGYSINDMIIKPLKGCPALEDLNVTYNEFDQIIQAVVLNSSVKSATYKYSITPIVKLSDDDADTPIQLKALTLSVKVNGGTPVLKMSAKGSIDLSNRENGIVYTLTGGQYFIYNSEKVDENSFVLTGKDADLFEVKPLGRNSKGQIQVLVKAKDASVMKSKTTYQYKLAGYVENIDKVVESSLFKVKTKQTSLKFTVSGDTTVYHSHRYGNELLIKVKSPTGASIEDLSVLQTKATTIPNGAMSFDLKENEDGTWSVKYDVIRASKLKAGKSYKLALSVVPEGNGTNVKAQTLTVTLKVKR